MVSPPPPPTAFDVEILSLKRRVNETTVKADKQQLENKIKALNRKRDIARAAILLDIENGTPLQPPPKLRRPILKRFTAVDYQPNTLKLGIVHKSK